MKLFINIFVISLVVAPSKAVPIISPQATTTASALIFSPSTLASYQHPVVLPNGVECIAPYLVVQPQESKPDQVFPKIAQIGPNAYVAMEFNSTHEGKMCRFHFTFSSLADGGNGIGTEDIYPLKSGVIDESLTWDTQPELESVPVASFRVTAAKVITGSPGGHEMYPAESKFDFNCPTAKTGWAIRGSPHSMSNWSWNHGLIIEVLGDKPWVDGNIY